MLLYTKDFNWIEPVKLGLRASINSFSASGGGRQGTSSGKSRWWVTGLMSDVAVEKKFNELLQSLDSAIDVLLPFFPIKCFTKDSFDLIGQTSIQIEGNIFKRPLTVDSQLNTSWPNPAFRGLFPLALMNEVTEAWEVHEITSAQADDPCGNVINSSTLTLDSPVGINIQRMYLVGYNYLQMRITNPVEVSKHSEYAGELALELEEIMPGEMG